MAKYRFCHNKECEKYLKSYNVAEHAGCPECGYQAGMNTSGNSQVQVGLKAASKGPLATYKDGDHSCFYTNELMLSAQETYL